jgi:hypothetical protein
MINSGKEWRWMDIHEANREDKIKELVERKAFDKVFTLKEVSRWIEYGMGNGLIEKKKDRDSIQNTIDWIEMLSVKRVEDDQWDYYSGLPNPKWYEEEE